VDDSLVFGWSGDALAARVQSFFEYTFTLPDASNAVARAAEFGKIWVWAVPTLPVLAWLGFIRTRFSPVTRLLMLSAACTLGGYLIFDLSQGHGWGNRYFHPAWMVLPVLGALALVPQTTRIAARERIAGGLVVGSLLLVNAAALTQVHGFIGRHLDQLPGSDGRPDAAVVLIDASRGYYTSDLIQNDPMLRTAPIILVSRGTEEDSRFMAARFPQLARIASDRYGSVWAAPVEEADR